VQKTGIFLDNFQSEVQRMLSIIDPFNKQYITFSETTTLFSTEFIVIEEQGQSRKLSLLEKISLDENILNNI
jgi:hypothetical protein